MHVLFDRIFLPFARRWYVALARGALFGIYAWFGILKVFDLSPATDLVRTLHEQTIAFIAFDLFFVAFGVFEVLIGALFLVRGWERWAICLMMAHMISTALPLVLVPTMTWSAFLVPTLEGQYIIKNIALIALAATLASTLSSAYRTKTEISR